MPKKHAFSSPPVGWTVLFVALAASLLALSIVYKKEALSLRSSAPSEATDSMFYKGLPLGALELNAYLLEESPEQQDRVLRAYAAGRLPVGPRVHNTPWQDRFAQAVRLPHLNEIADPLAEAACGYYNGICDLILDGSYSDPSARRYISGVVGREGYMPLKFLTRDTLLLRGRFGDGPCGTTYYKDLDFLSASSTHSLAHTTCYSDTDMYFAVDGKNVLSLIIRDQKTGGSITSSKLYQIEIQQGEKTIQTLKNIVPPKGNAWDETVNLDWIRPDVDAYFTNPSELRLLLDDTAYTFPIPQS